MHYVMTIIIKINDTDHKEISPLIELDSASLSQCTHFLIFEHFHIEVIKKEMMY